MKNISFLVLLLLIFSCTNELKIKASVDVDNSIAINCTFSPEQAWKIDVIKTKGVEDSLNYISLSEADIHINEDNWIPDDFKFVPAISTFEFGYYTNILSEKNVHSNENIYTIKIEHDGYDTVTASDTVPPKPIIKNLGVTQIEVEEQIVFGDLPKRYIIEGSLNFNIENLGPEANYLVKILFENDYIADLFGNKTDSLYYSEAIINFNNIDHDLFFNSFKGFQLNNSDNQIQINFSHNSLKDLEIPMNMIVEISSISNVYYEYLENLNEIKQVVQNPFSNQVIPFSNVEGGYGIFAAFNSEIDTLSF